MRLLVIEDNRHIVANIFDYFEARGHILDAAPDGVVGLHLATTQTYDAIILDWMLPRMDGVEVLRRLRQEYDSDVPVIFLTARDELPDKVVGFRTGADDYLTKPFVLPELELRLEVICLRGRRGGRNKVLRIQDVTFDVATLEARRAGRTLHLYPACRKLLEVLMRASPDVVTKERLERALWGDEPPNGDMLRSHIYDLRRSLDGPFEIKLLHTVPRVGYRLAGPDQGETHDA